ncbi:MAG: hypothetical protein ACI83W_000928 [Marinoscillum sp.]|jgi:hypothetical protein
MNSFEWRTLHISDKGKFKISKDQVHQAMQNVAAVGRKFLPKTPYDQQSTLVWVPGLTRMAGGWVEGEITFRSSISLTSFEVFLVDSKVNTIASFPLEGQTYLQLMLWLEEQIGKLGLNASNLTMKLPYELPIHEIQKGEPFLPMHKRSFEELASFYHDSYVCLRELKNTLEGAEEIVIWPHHFDQSLNVTLKDSGDLDTNTTLSFGMSPGDETFESPYFYVNTWPHVDTSLCSKLSNQAIWVSEEWTGAVLLAKHIIDADQKPIIDNFYLEAADKLKKLLID